MRPFFFPPTAARPLVDDLLFDAFLARDLLLAPLALFDELLERDPLLVLVLVVVRPLRLDERRAAAERALEVFLAVVLERVLEAERALERDLALPTDFLRLAERDLPARDLAFLLAERLGLFTQTCPHTLHISYYQHSSHTYTYYSMLPYFY